MGVPAARGGHTSVQVSEATKQSPIPSVSRLDCCRAFLLQLKSSYYCLVASGA